MSIPMRLICPECGQLHVDVGEFATKPHHTHACQHCGHVWRPAVAHTVGVRFLPGFKNSPGLAGSGLLGDLPEAAPGDVLPAPLVGSPGRTGEVCGCDESKALRLCLRRALDDFYDEADDWTDQASELLGDARRSKLDNLEDLVRELRPQAKQTKQARAERDRAASAIAKARAVCLALHVAPDPSPPALAESIRELAIALQEYDAEEIPF